MNGPIQATRLERWRAGFAEAKGILDGGTHCPTAEELWASARGALDPARNEALILHLARCPACAEGWRLARTVQDERPIGAAGGTSGRWRLPTLLVAAAALIGIVGLALYLGRPPIERRAVYRDLEAARLVSEIAEDAVLPRDACVLRWSGGPEGTTYDVRVATGDLEPIVEVWRLERNELRVDPSLLRDLPDGAVLLWRVTAHPPSGAPFSSETFWTRLGPPE